MGEVDIYNQASILSGNVIVTLSGFTFCEDYFSNGGKK